jgi:hypothetical protein
MVFRLAHTARTKQQDQIWILPVKRRFEHQGQSRCACCWMRQAHGTFRLCKVIIVLTQKRRRCDFKCRSPSNETGICALACEQQVEIIAKIQMNNQIPRQICNANHDGVFV